MEEAVEAEAVRSAGLLEAVWAEVVAPGLVAAAGLIRLAELFRIPRLAGLAPMWRSGRGLRLVWELVWLQLRSALASA